MSVTCDRLVVFSGRKEVGERGWEVGERGVGGGREEGGRWERVPPVHPLFIRFNLSNIKLKIRKFNVSLNDSIVKSYCWFFQSFSSVKILFYLRIKIYIGGGNHRPAASHWQNVSHNVVSSTPHLSVIRTRNVIVLYM